MAGPVPGSLGKRQGSEAGGWPGPLRLPSFLLAATGSGQRGGAGCLTWAIVLAPGPVTAHWSLPTGATPGLLNLFMCYGLSGHLEKTVDS